jgi:hypothetical protein
MINLRLPALVAGTMLFGFSPAVAGSITGQMSVSASVGQACTLAATPLAFGALGIEAKVATTTITLDCSGPGTLATVLVGGGQNQNAATPFGQLKSGAGDMIPWTMMLTPATAVIAADGAVTLVPSTVQDNSYSVALVAEIAGSDAYVEGMYVDVVTLTTTYTFAAP